ncbi:hypothetical protein F53441_3049 [Fusarium austroafricanum]|uniref:Cell wall protein n=1 Tax=Fusarium austroafricanum TaxID=2364996 RepID=A0A8H4KSF1_9HYPO|nr:hypothetical protein F53441_3049 [Fusarium austroafricanum]
MRSAMILTVGATVVAASHPALENLNKRDAKECASVGSSILPQITDFPKPDRSLASFLATQTAAMTMTDRCVIPEVTGSLSKEYSSYASKLSSYLVDVKENLSKFEKACSDVPEVSSIIKDLKETATVCDKVTWAKQTDSSSDSKSGDKKDGGNAAGTNSIKAGIVLAVAGLAGVMML